MTWDQTVFALVAGAVASIAVTLAGAWASRRFGLPGLARAVDAHRGSLVQTLKDELAEVRTQLDEEKRERQGVERRRQACEIEIRNVKRDLRDTQAELLDLYRRTGKRPPRRLEEHAQDTTSDDR